MDYPPEGAGGGVGGARSGFSYYMHRNIPVQDMTVWLTSSETESLQRHLKHPRICGSQVILHYSLNL